MIWHKSNILFYMAKILVESGLYNATNSNLGVILVCSVGRLTINFSNALFFFAVIPWLLWTEKTTQHCRCSALMEQHFFASLCHNWFWYTCRRHSCNQCFTSRYCALWEVHYDKLNIIAVVVLRTCWILVLVLWVISLYSRHVYKNKVREYNCVCEAVDSMYATRL